MKAFFGLVLVIILPFLMPVHDYVFQLEPERQPAGNKDWQNLLISNAVLNKRRINFITFKLIIPK